jgi:hypothetical protein
MKSHNIISKSDVSFGQNLAYATRYYLGSRRALIVLPLAAAVAGLILNWSWLVALGVAPILLTALPCLAMCALGLCMHKMSGQSCSKEARPTETMASTQADGTSVSSDARAGPIAARATVSDTREIANATEPVTTSKHLEPANDRT